MCLHPNGPQECHDDLVFKLVPTTQTTRYLGIPVSAAPEIAQAWTATCRAVQARTILALRKTADVLQRCRLAASIIIPKILHVARHVWPTGLIVKQLDKAVHNFVWRGVFVHESSHGRKALLNRYHSHLRLDEGGVGDPNVSAEIRALAAVTVTNWAGERPRHIQILGDVLLWNRKMTSKPWTAWITPAHVDTGAPTWKTTLWTLEPQC